MNREESQCICRVHCCRFPLKTFNSNEPDLSPLPVQPFPASPKHFNTHPLLLMFPWRWCLHSKPLVSYSSHKERKRNFWNSKVYHHDFILIWRLPCKSFPSFLSTSRFSVLHFKFHKIRSQFSYHFGSKGSISCKYWEVLTVLADSFERYSLVLLFLTASSYISCGWCTPS